MDCGFAIHRAFGPGLLESAYETLMFEMLFRKQIGVARQVPISIRHNDICIDDVYRVDLMVGNKLIVELKSVEKLAPVHAKQLLTYLRITGSPVGLLMNFGEAMLKDGIRRIINDRTDYIAPPLNRR